MELKNFILTQNLDLPNESFIIKEGTKLSIRKEGKNYIASFLGINGSYIFNEMEYNAMEDTLRDITEQRYQIGQRVMYVRDGREAIIERADYNHVFEQIFYIIKFQDNTLLGVLASQLRLI